MFVRLPEKRARGISDSFYVRLVVVLVIIFLVFISWFIYRVNYLKSHPYTMQTSATKTTIQKVGKVVPVDSRNVISILNNKKDEINLGYQLLGTITDKVFKTGGANMYVEGPNQLTENVSEFTYTIKDVPHFVKEHKITNLAQLSNLISSKVLSDTDVYEKLHKQDALGLGMLFDIKGDNLTCIFRMSHINKKLKR